MSFFNDTKHLNMYLARDFIITTEGLIFAVTLNGIEDKKVISCLRYVPVSSGLHKVDTREAISLLRTSYPQYLHYSRHRDVTLQAVALNRIQRHLRPREKLSALMSHNNDDPLIELLQKLVNLLGNEGVECRNMGITGSLLAGTQHVDSDIDLVIYGRESFELARRAIRRLSARNFLQPPSMALWQTTYRRRGCALSFPDYLWHEQRKFNKGAIDGIKFDLVLVEQDDRDEDQRRWWKTGRVTIQALVTDAKKAFATPARYNLDHPEIPLALSFTATYTGQAMAGEKVEISGIVELSPDGDSRIIVGSSREAPGEYIKVIHS